MSSITSGIGLSSGLDIASLIDQMLALEARRAIPIRSRIDRVSSARTSLQQNRSLLLMLRSASVALRSPSTIAAQSIASSNPAILTAALGNGTPASGSLSMIVRSIATASRLVSAGLFSASDPLGAGSFTLRFGSGRLQDDRALSTLNGGAGIVRGMMRITDRSGSTAVIDLRHALSIDDVLDAVNAADSIDIEARLSDDGRAIELVDGGSGNGSIIVQEWGGGHTAQSLGLLLTSGGGAVLTGETIARLGSPSRLDSIGAGVPIADGAPSFVVRIDGTDIAVDLGAGAGGAPPRATTLGDVVDRVNAAIASAGFGATASISIDPLGERLSVSYTGTGSLAFVAPTPVMDGGVPAIETLRALGLAGVGIDHSLPSASTIALGERLVLGMHDVSLARLDGGAGLVLDGALTLVDRAGRSVTIDDFSGVDSIETLRRRISLAADAAGMDLDVGLDPSATRLRISDGSDGTGPLLASGAIADQLGLAPRSNAGELQSRDLRRADVGLGTPLDRIAGGPVSGALAITTRSGSSATISLSPGMTLLDLARAVTESGLPVSVAANGWGDAVELIDHSSGPASFTVVNASGNAASALRIAGSSSTGRIDGTRTVSMDLDGSEDAATLATMLDALDGIDAALVTGDDGELRLVVDALQTGARNDLVLSIDGADLDWSSAVRGRDARVLLSPEEGAGTLVTGDTNRFTDLLPGAILDLVSASDDVVTVTVAPSDQPILNAVSSFVTALRQAILQLRQATAVDPDAGTRGPLYGNVAAARAREALRSLVGANFGPEGRRLSKLGIVVAGDGTVTFDEVALAAALEADPEAVRAQLADVNGVSQRFESVLGAFVEPGAGALDTDDSRLSRILDAANATIDRINDGLVRRRAVLMARFTAMELAIERLRAQQTTMLSILAGATGGGG